MNIRYFDTMVISLAVDLFRDVSNYPHAESCEFSDYW